MLGSTRIWTRRSRSKVSYAYLITTNLWKVLKNDKNFGPGDLKFKFLKFLKNKSSKQTLLVHQGGLKDNCQKVFNHITPSQSRLESFKVKRGWWSPHVVWNRVKTTAKVPLKMEKDCLLYHLQWKKLQCIISSKKHEHVLK